MLSSKRNPIQKMFSRTEHRRNLIFYGFQIKIQAGIPIKLAHVRAHRGRSR